MKRRTLLQSAALLTPAAASAAAPPHGVTATVSLNGEWLFAPGSQPERRVTVPHTWQTDAALSSYMGAATYRRTVDIPADWKGSVVRIEFESVFHSAWVSVNGQKAGEHIGKGYTAFTLDVTALLEYGKPNRIEVRCDNSFNDAMLPRGKSYDWTPDGGIYRPARLLVTPPVYIERIEIDSELDLASGEAKVTIRPVVRGGTAAVAWTIEEEETGRLVASGSGPSATIKAARRWHFDHPNLYRCTVTAGAHAVTETFGIRKLEARDGAIFLNGERVWLAGVERMAGSQPQYGMAEPASWIEHDHRDMKHLNCVITRVHWMQDRRVLDFCDRQGMLMQVEVPTWGAATFDGMKDEPSPAILNNGLEQLREMVAQNRNHPCIFAWGLCNEIGGQNPPAKQFARKMFTEARRLDPGRLLSYASNTLHSHTADDVAGEMDILEWNEYYESWYRGDAESVRGSLKQIRARYPNKPIIISEYGLCECDPKNPTGDERRIQVLKSHNAVYRDEPNVAGLIFFCYNDYRTHIGDKGLGVLRQRVHGVVDVYGDRKPSYEVLRNESSPVESLTLTPASAVIKTRAKIPAHTLRGYTLRITVYGYGGLPMEQQEFALPVMRPGAQETVLFQLKDPAPKRIVAEVVRPTGYSAFTATRTI
jgi:beta-galactosidase